MTRARDLAAFVSNADGDVKFDTDTLFIDSSANKVGIGTTSPAKELSISGATDPTLRITDTTNTVNLELLSGNSEAYIGTQSNHPLLFTSNNTERMRIDDSGKVGIGTTTPKELLNSGAHVVEGDHATGVNAMGGSVGLLLHATGDTGFVTATSSGSNNRNLQLRALNAGSANANQLFLSYTGDVGIGTTSPSANLHVAQSGNNVALYAGGGSYNFQAKFESSDTEAAIIIEDSNSTNDANRIGVVGDQIVLTAGNSECMRLTNNKDVFFGTTSNSYPTNLNFVHINEVSSVSMVVGGHSGTHTVVQFRHNGATTVGSIVVDGSSTTYNTSSDYRLKENLTNISDGITRVKQLKPKRFNFIVDADKTVDGFLAHEASTVVPEAVTGEKDGLEVWKEKEKDELPDGVSVGDNKLDADGNTIPEYQGIDQSKLVPLLTAALQEAIAKIETLESENTAIKARLDALEAE